MPRRKIKPDEDTVQFTFRMPVSLHKRINELALKEERTLSQELRWLLHLSVEIREKELQKPDKK
jgi:hypothetical protein